MINITEYEFPLGATTNGIAFFLLIITTVYCLKNFSFKNKYYRPFYMILLITYIEVAVHLLTVAIQEEPFFTHTCLGRIMYSLVFTIDSIYIMSWIDYLDNRIFRLIHKDQGYRKHVTLLSLPIMFLLVCSLVNMVTPVFFSYVDDTYARQPLYNLTTIIPLAYLAYGIYSYWRSDYKFRVYREIPFIELLIPTVVSHSLEWIFMGLCIIPLGHVITFLILVMNNEKLKIAEDSLTGLYNKHEFYNYLGRVHRAKKGDNPIIGVMIDLDDFKEINDTFGHIVGDEALADFGHIIKSTLPRNALGFRYAGDEFILIFENSDEEAVQKTLADFQTKLDEFNTDSGKQYKLYSSAGFTTWAETDSTSSFIVRMDQNMYYNKTQKKSRHELPLSSPNTSLINGLSEDTVFETLGAYSHDMALFITDLATGNTAWSENVKEFFDFPDDYEKHTQQLEKERIHPDDYEHYIEAVINILSGKTTNQFVQFRMADSKGEYHLYQSNGRIRVDKQSNKSLFIGSIMRLDTSEAYDQLTKLFNMNHFLTLASAQIHTQNQDTNYNVIYFDIKNFKMLNIERGLQNGNIILRQVAMLLEKHFRGDLLSRFSDDHFVVLSSKKNVTQIFDNMQQEFLQLTENLELRLKAGIYPVKEHDHDIALASDLAKDAVELIKNKEQDLYIFDDALERKLSIERYVIQNIDEAVERQWIHVYFQPVIRAQTGVISGFESLARWIDPTYGLLSPLDFIPVLENAAQIHKLDQYVIREVCKTIGYCLTHDIPIAPISINLSRVDITKYDTVAYINEMTATYGVPHNMLNVEITESVAISDIKATQDCIKDLKSSGYHVWMDDFGSGYSSLNALINFDFDEIKLDMDFMRNFNESSQKVLTAIITMAKNMGLTTISEGVETSEQLAFLRSIGCDKIQGYYYSKPLPFDQILEFRKKTGIGIEERK